MFNVPRADFLCRRVSPVIAHYMSSLMILPIVVLICMAGTGLLAALRPEVWMEVFLSKSQREHLTGRMDFVRDFGWVFFACTALIAVALVFTR
jgi:hypothetical protein